MSHATRAHANWISPSGASRWSKCPQSPRLSADLPNTSSVYADEGTAAHMLREWCLESGLDAIQYLGDTITVRSDVEFIVDEDMASAVQVDLDDLRPIIKRADFHEVEAKYDLSHVFEGMFGTADFVAYVGAEKRLYVRDYKHGRGVAVDVRDNLQLILYALGAVYSHHNLPLERIELTVVQPRAFHKDGPIRRWDTDPVSLLEAEDYIREAAKRTLDENAPFLVGDHCKFCKATAFCPAMEEKVRETVKLDFGEPVTVTSLSGDELAKKLTDVEVIEDWCRRLREYAFNEAQQGRCPPGFKLVQKRALRKWRDEDAAAARMTVDLGLDPEEVWKKKIISPAQADKLLKKRKDEITDLVVKESSGVKLVDESDPAPAVKADAADDFLN
jgi:hypothetical protein